MPTPSSSLPSWRPAILVACALAACAPALSAQSRDRWEDEERGRRQRIERERQQRERERQARERSFRGREQRLQREHQARLRAEDQRRLRLQRQRAARAEVVRRPDGWGDSYRPRLSLGGGLDVRRFGGEDNRYLGQLGVDFRSRSGLGVRPEVVFGWTDRSSRVLTGQPACVNCAGGVPLALFAPVTSTGRSRMLGVAVTGTYTFLRSSPVRPYALSGLGIFSTRTPQPELVITNPGSPTPQYDLRAGYRNDLDVGLTAGAGLEFSVGPTRLFSEVRYLLSDDARPLGFSGMLPLTVGLRF